MSIKRFLSFVAIAMLVPVLLAHGNKEGQAKLKVEGGEVVIDFTGPALKGRDIEEMLKLPRANPWQMGADRATMLKTPVSLVFDTDTLPAGEYLLKAFRDDQNQWWLHCYSGGLTTPFSAKLKLDREEASSSEENMTIGLSGSAMKATFKLQWGTWVLVGHFGTK